MTMCSSGRNAVISGSFHCVLRYIFGGCSKVPRYSLHGPLTPFGGSSLLIIVGALIVNEHTSPVKFLPVIGATLSSIRSSMNSSHGP